MATTRGGVRGDASRIPAGPVPRNRDPEPQHLADFATLFEGVDRIHVRAVGGFRALGFAGPDLAAPAPDPDAKRRPREARAAEGGGGRAGMITVLGERHFRGKLCKPAECAILIVEAPGFDRQEPAILANMAARGVFELLPDEGAYKKALAERKALWDASEPIREAADAHAFDSRGG